jgi:hypothetical protein
MGFVIRKIMTPYDEEVREFWNRVADDWDIQVGDDGDSNRRLNSDPTLWKFVGNVQGLRCLGKYVSGCSGRGSLPNWYLIIASQTEITLRYISLSGSRIASRTSVDNWVSPLMNHKKICVSNKILICPRMH